MGSEHPKLKEARAMLNVSVPAAVPGLDWMEDAEARLRALELDRAFPDSKPSTAEFDSIAAERDRLRVELADAKARHQANRDLADTYKDLAEKFEATITRLTAPVTADELDDATHVVAARGGSSRMDPHNEVIARRLKAPQASDLRNLPSGTWTAVQAEPPQGEPACTCGAKLGAHGRTCPVALASVARPTADEAEPPTTAWTCAKCGADECRCVRPEPVAAPVVEPPTTLAMRVAVDYLGNDDPPECELLARRIDKVFAGTEAECVSLRERLAVAERERDEARNSQRTPSIIQLAEALGETPPGWSWSDCLEAVRRLKAHRCPPTATADEVVEACATRVDIWLGVGSGHGESLRHLKGRFTLAEPRVSSGGTPIVLTDDEAGRLGESLCTNHGCDAWALHVREGRLVLATINTVLASRPSPVEGGKT